MPTLPACLLATLLGLAPLAATHAQDAPDALSSVDALSEDAPQGLMVVAEAVPATVAPGGTFELVVHVTIPAGQHGYPDAKQTSAGPSSLYFTSPGGMQFDAPVWPKAQEMEFFGEKEKVYHGEVLIRTKVKAPATPGVHLAKGAFKGRYCDDKGSCFPAKEYPFEAKVTVEAPAAPAAPAPVAPAAEQVPANAVATPQANPTPTPAAAAKVTVTADTAPTPVAPGQPFAVMVRVTVAPGLHTYPDKAQNADDFSTLQVTDAAGLKLAPAQWPQGKPHKNVFGKMEAVYDGSVSLRITGTAPSQPGTRTVKGTFTSYACDDKGHCFPTKTHPWEAQVVVDSAAAPSAGTGTGNDEAPASTRKLEPISFDLPWGKKVVDPNTAGGLGLFLLLAAVGGFVLNFMPCVLPVIPIKILGLAQAAGTRSRRLLLGGVMSGGVVALWLGMGAILAFTSVLGGTADIFRHPWVNLLLGLFIVLMALVSTGVLALRLPQFLYRVNPKHDSLAGSFGFGLMTGVFALPCTGPFMGTAAAAVLGAGDARLTLAVFTAIGVGMALPYFVLAANPKWVEKLPRSGPASDVMKSFLGWLMLAGGVYFIQSGITQWVQPESHFGKRAGVMVALALFTVSGLVLAKGCVGLLKTSAHKLAPGVFLALGLGLAALGGWQIQGEVAARPFPFLPFEGETQLPIGKGKITVVDFRSTNCLNCDYNEKTVFNTTAGKSLLGTQDVIAYQANIDHAQAADYLQKISNNVAVPFLAVYDANGVLVEKMSAIITTEQLRLALDKARHTPSPQPQKP